MGIFAQIGGAIGALTGKKKQAPQEEQSPRFQKLRDFREMYGGEQYERRGLSAPWDKQADGGRHVPLRKQKPSTQYDLPRLLVDRPTAMLFGEGRFPELGFTPQETGVDVADINSWLKAIAEEGELAHNMLIAARQGGAMGTAVVTWSVVEGEFEFEAHPALFCKPTFHPRKRRRLVELEKRYKFKQEVEVMTSTGVQYRERDFWHREVWTETQHIVYKDVIVPEDGSEPLWTEDSVVDHSYGRCPAVWIKNLDDGDTSDMDGCSLLYGSGDIVEDIDRTLSQKSRAVRYNQDPERIYYGLSEEQVKKLKVGGGATTLLPGKPAGDVSLVELQGEGQRIAEEHVISQRGRALETARVVSPEPERLLSAARSGAALRILFSPMLELVGELRTCYGRGLRDILTQILDAAREGKIQKLGSLDTPPPASIPPGKIKLQWGRHFEPTPEDLSTIATALQTLKATTLIDSETLVTVAASYLGIKDVQHVLETAQAEADHAAAQENAAMMGTKPPTRPSKKPSKPAAAPAPSQKAGASKSASAPTDEGE